MKTVSAEEYNKMLAEDLAWAENLLSYQAADPRLKKRKLTNRPITSIKNMFETSCELFKDNVAFYTKFQKGPYEAITYGQFHDDYNGLGTALIKHGLKDKRISIIGETNYPWSCAYVSVVGGTGVVVPLDRELPYADLKNLIKTAGVSAVIFDKKREPMFVKMLEEGDTPLELLISQDRREDGDGILSMWKLMEEGKSLISDGDRSFLDAQIDSKAMAVILFTSGTTGMAKGVMLSNRNLCADIMAAPTWMDYKPGDVFFSVLPIHHTFECTCDFLTNMYKGAAIAHCEGLKYIVKNIQEIHPHYILAVPAIFEALYKAIWKGIKAKGKEKTVRRLMKLSDALRKVGINLTGLFFKEIKQTLGGRMENMICGGAAINPQILKDLCSFGFTAVQGYGLTEAAPMGALNPGWCSKADSCGIPFPGFDAKIADADANGIGEICLKGDNIMMGYYENPEATAEVIKDGWFHTGDLGYMDEKKYIFITGRKKNVIITKNGKNVFPEEIEYQLKQSDVIEECMVFEDSSENKDDFIIAAAIYPDWTAIRAALGDKAEDNEEVEKYLWTVIDKVNEENPGYKMIKRLYLRHKEFEKNTAHKIIRFRQENKQSN